MDQRMFDSKEPIHGDEHQIRDWWNCTDYVDHGPKHDEGRYIDFWWILPREDLASQPNRLCDKRYHHVTYSQAEYKPVRDTLANPFEHIKSGNDEAIAKECQNDENCNCYGRNDFVRNAILWGPNLYGYRRTAVVGAHDGPNISCCRLGVSCSNQVLVFGVAASTSWKKQRRLTKHYYFSRDDFVE